MSTSCPPYTSKPWQKKRVQPGRWKAVPQCSESPWPCESVRASAGVCCASHASVAQFPTFSRFMTRCRTKDTGTRLSVQPWHKCHRIRLQGRRRLLSYCTSPTETTAGATPTEAGGASAGAAGAWAGDRAGPGAPPMAPSCRLPHPAAQPPGEQTWPGDLPVAGERRVLLTAPCDLLDASFAPHPH